MLNPCTFKPGSLTQALKSDLTLEHARTSPPSSTPDYLTEALRMKRSNLRRSASNGEHGDGDKATHKERQEGERRVCFDSVRLELPVLAPSLRGHGERTGVLQVHSALLESSFPNVDGGIFPGSHGAHLPKLGVVLKSIGYTVLEITIANKEKPTSHQKSWLCCPVSVFLPGLHPRFLPGSSCRPCGPPPGARRALVAVTLS